MLHNYLYTLKLVGFFNLIHLFRCPLWLYANWRCPARLFSSALLVPIAFGLGDSQCFHPLLSFGVSFFAAFILIFGFAQIEDRVKRLSCFCSPRGPNGGRVARGHATHASHNASLALWQMCFCHTDARTDRDRFVSFS